MLILILCNLLAGLCGLSGVLILSSHGGGDISGTFCNDGAFVLPRYERIYKKFVIIVLYSLRWDLVFTWKSTLLENKMHHLYMKHMSYKYSWHRYVTKQVDWQFYKLYHFQYNMKQNILLFPSHLQSPSGKNRYSNKKC